MPLIRLNKYLASLGVASRRKIDEFTSQRRITINGRIAILGDKVNTEIDNVVVDKKIIPPHPQKLVYYLLNKPKYVLCTSSDDRGRDTVLNYVPKGTRVYPVGRLDYESTGLILLTNDGDLSLKLTHPRYHLPKVYLVTLLGKTPQSKIASMVSPGVKAEIVSQENNHTIIKITLFEGKKRQIRLLCASLHLYVLDLQRISIGPLLLNRLAPGEYRELSSSELKSIRL
ncbi:rRNA pseudouridine synthase [Candidatus Shapirobacteria bacterium]|nr:rRNA pseudouridine synthase [Candidatus Shapirobacteria bacterium]